MIIRLPIDIKSLYMNIKNDNKSGHTATVATPLKQGSSVHEKLSHILEIPELSDQITREELVTLILSKSRAEAIIPNVYVFDKIRVNGIELSDVPAFCMYIREETGKDNVHCGRQKVHYPPSLNYEDENVLINNKKVMEAISVALHDYAFIIEAFEYDTVTGILNFDALVVGENGIPYSKVFLNKRGTGNKFSAAFTESTDNYDTEIIALREHLGYENVTPDNYHDIHELNRLKAIQIVADCLTHDKKGEIRHLSADYPYSLYDLELKNNEQKDYVIIRHTATNLTYFSLPYGKIRFLMDYKANVRLALVKDIVGEPTVEWYSSDEINVMNKSINSVVYQKRG